MAVGARVSTEYKAGLVAGQHKAKNLIVVALDGYRWKELFQSADSLVIFNRRYAPRDSPRGSSTVTETACWRIFLEKTSMDRDLLHRKMR